MSTTSRAIRAGSSSIPETDAMSRSYTSACDAVRVLFEAPGEPLCLGHQQFRNRTPLRVDPYGRPGDCQRGDELGVVADGGCVAGDLVDRLLRLERVAVAEHIVELGDELVDVDDRPA